MFTQQQGGPGPDVLVGGSFLIPGCSRLSPNTSGRDGFSDRTPAHLNSGTAAPRAGEGVSAHPEPPSLPFFLQPVLCDPSEELAMVAMPQLRFLRGERPGEDSL